MNIHRLIIVLIALTIVVALSVAFIGRWSENQLDWGAGYSALLFLGFVVLSRGSLVEYATLFCVVVLMLLFRDRSLIIAQSLPFHTLEIGFWVLAGLVMVAFALRDALFKRTVIVLLVLIAAVLLLLLGASLPVQVGLVALIFILLLAMLVGSNEISTPHDTEPAPEEDSGQEPAPPGCGPEEPELYSQVDEEPQPYDVGGNFSWQPGAGRIALLLNAVFLWLSNHRFLITVLIDWVLRIILFWWLALIFYKSQPAAIHYLGLILASIAVWVVLLLVVWRVLLNRRVF